MIKKKRILPPQTPERIAAFVQSGTATRFKPGCTGRPVGSRNKLGEAFIAALQADFDAHGADAIVACRKHDPVGYVRVLASILPKELEVRRPLGDLNDDELVNAIELIRVALADDTRVAGTGAADASEREPASDLSSIH